jgi:hypothetical protein
MYDHPLIFLLYDGIENSVFESQVLQPCIRMKKKAPQRTVCIISFEIHTPSSALRELVRSHDIEIIIIKRRRFIAHYLLYPEIKALRNILTQFPYYSIKARGPLAGYLALKASSKKNCLHIIIQARGLLAQEYAYSNQERTMLFKPLVLCRTFLYASLEYAVYKKMQKVSAIYVVIEAVSPALKEYIVTTYKTSPEHISIAQDDLPEALAMHQKSYWRKAIRSSLGLSQDAFVYVYCGTAKSWQCPKEMIRFFASCTKPEKHLLILSQDSDIFSSLMHAYQIDPKTFTLISCKQEKVLEYLCAADVGLLFRERHILNFVSRPTKLLEYLAVGLEIEHNNTISDIAYYTELFTKNSEHRI